VSELKMLEIIERAPGPFDSRADAARIANGVKPAAAPARNFRRIHIREVRSNAPA